ncbi:MAG: hypothetical protein ACOCV2_03420, partial [Persicimonas sp.]
MERGALDAGAERWTLDAERWTLDAESTEAWKGETLDAAPRQSAWKARENAETTPACGGAPHSDPGGLAPPV